MAKKKEKKVETFAEEQEEPVEESTEEVVEEPVEETVDEEAEEVTEEPSEEKKEEPEEIVEEDEDTVETFKAQLVQAFELNDKLLDEINTKDKEISVFREIKTGLEDVIETQQQEITQLKNELEGIQLSLFKDKISGLADKWIKKYGLSAEKKQEVMTMLAKFQSDEELHKVEELLGLKGVKEKSIPVPLTQTSATLMEQFGNKPEQSYDDLTPDQKKELLWKKMQALNGLK